jgi:type II secretory pathway predicted ATPase ExeA
MYEEFYGLREKPFSIIPDPDIIYWGHNHLLAFAMLEFGVTNSAGFTVITGDIGSGKTTLIRYLLHRLDPKIVVGLMSNTPPGTEGLLRWVMMSLNQPFEDSYAALFQRFHEFIRKEYHRGRRTILIVDEAQNLGVDALEELRMLTNVNVDKHQCLQIILVGQPQLKDLLRSPRLVQFAQRVSSDFHLRPLDAEEVANYITHRLTAVGARSQLFTRRACDLIAEVSRGIPRTINILCDTALVYGFAANVQQIDQDLICQVIKHKTEYGVLPLPGSPIEDDAGTPTVTKMPRR